MEALQGIIIIIKVFYLLFILLFLLVLCIRLFKIKKNLKSKKNLKIDDKRFEEMYNNMLENINMEELEELRNKAIRKNEKNKNIFKIVGFVVIILALISFVLMLEQKFMVAIILVYTIIIGPIIFVILLGKKKKSDITIYQDKYKEKVIPEFLRQFEEKIKYYPAEGMPMNIYNVAEIEKYDRYKSEDMMDIILKNDCRAKMAEVYTEYKTKDSEGKIHYHPLFRGIFALIETPKKFKEELYVKQDKELTIRSITPKCEKIQLDSPEFEQYFDIYGTNKIVTMQLLTADVMQMFIDFRKDTGIRFDFVIKKNRIFLRFFCGSIFEHPYLKESLLDKNLMYRNYKILDFTFDLTYKITKLIEETDY